MNPEGNAFGDIKSQDSEGANLVFDNSGFLYSSIEITGKEYEVDVIL